MGVHPQEACMRGCVGLLNVLETLCSLSLSVEMPIGTLTRSSPCLPARLTPHSSSSPNSIAPPFTHKPTHTPHTTHTTGRRQSVMWRQLSPSSVSCCRLLAASAAARRPQHLALVTSIRRTSASSSSSSSSSTPTPKSIAPFATSSTHLAAVVSEGELPPPLPSPVKDASGLRNVVGLCAELGKARLSALVVLTTSAGFLAAGGPVAWVPLTAVSVGTMLAACSANTFNQLIETENDRLMKRTFLRPLPSRRASRPFAMAWGLGSAGASAAILAAGTTPLTVALGMGNLALYALPYTLSKTRSEINTWIGAVVGAVPPLMGWAAATECTSLEALLSTPDAMLLAGALFLWQFPHFFALSWVHRKDYARGGFKMVPCADPGGERTAELIWRYSLYLAPLPLLATGMGVTGSMFALEGSLLNAYLVYLAGRFRKVRTDEGARAVFRCSLWYLPVLLAAFVFHSKQWDAEKVRSGQEEMKGGMTMEALVAGARKQLTKVCVHEVLVQEGKNRHAGVLCPPVVATNVVEETKEVAGKMREEAEKAGGVQVHLTLSAPTSTGGGGRE